MKENMDEFLKKSLSNLEFVGDSSKIIGQPIYLKTDQVIIPINRIFYCYGSGSTEFKKRSTEELTYEFASDRVPYGGELSGVNIRPEAFLLIDGHNAKVIKIEEPSLYAKTLSLAIDTLKNLKKEKQNKH